MQNSFSFSIISILLGSMIIPATVVACTRAKSDSNHASSYLSCLPAEIQPADIVSANLVTGTTVKKVTVAQKLKTLQAKCQNTQLADGTGREIRFYQLQGCWGTPSLNADKIRSQQRRKLAALQQSYTVVEMTCNPGGFPLP
jgi:hypothetical protein